jgi:hypothetical protein
LAFADFVALDDVGGIDLLSGLGIYLAVFDAVARRFVDLIKADFLSLAARRKLSNRTRDERELQIAFPIRTRGHGLLHTKGDAVAKLALSC